MEENVVKDRKVFVANLRWMTPIEGRVEIAARDEAHARELCEAQFAGREGLVIVDIFNYDQLELPLVPANDNKPKLIVN